MSTNFLRMQKWYFEERGELQNNQITGPNADEKTRCKRLLNLEMKELVSFHPPFAHSQWHLRVLPSVTLKSSGTNSISGSKNRPWIIDSTQKLAQRDVWRVVADGAYRRVVTSVSNRESRAVYNLDSSLKVETSSSDGWSAYKLHYPLPHDIGFFDTIYYEDGELPLWIANSRAEYEAHTMRQQESDKPRFAAVNIFSNRWSQYKYQETGVTTATGSRVVEVADDGFYEIGDVVLFGNKYVHTIEGVSTTDNRLWLDRNFVGTTSFQTMQLCPNEHTEFLSLWRRPISEEDIIVDGYRRPVDLIADTDVSIFPDRLVPTIVIGALLRDKLGREVLSQQWVAYYDKVVNELRDSKKKNTDLSEIPYPEGFGNRGGNMSSEYNWGNIGL